MTAALSQSDLDMVELNSLALSGPALDWAVAMALELPVTILPPHYGTGPRVFVGVGSAVARQYRFSPSTDWAQAGVYIQRYDFTFKKVEDGIEASASEMYAEGSDHRVAMCRAVVAGLAGQKIYVPVELLNY